MITKLKHRFTADRFAFMMTGAFGLALIVAIGANIAGYCLYEGNWGVRIAEIVIGLMLIAFAVWGVRRLGKGDKRGEV